MSESDEIKNEKCVIILGSYINACSIIRSLIQLKVQNRIVVVETGVVETKCMAEVLYPKDVLIIKERISDSSGVIPLINKYIPKECYKIILMTEEAYIEPVRLAIRDGLLVNARSYTGSGIDNDIIFDRFKFYQFVNGIGCFNIPKTISSDEDPGRVFGNEYIIRLKKSWEGNKKLPRLKIVSNEAERQQIEQSFIDSGITKDMWCYQEVLSTLDTHNISICGWYDKDFHQFAVTRKVLQHPPKTGNGDVVEIIHDFPEDLVSSTMILLKTLDYTGAFELEFVYDLKSNTYKLIELNPRFWMQHALIDKVTNYSLIRRALGEESVQEISYKSLKHRYWINGNQALYRLIKGQICILKFLVKGVFYPHVFQSIKWALYYSKYKTALRRTMKES